MRKILALSGVLAIIALLLVPGFVSADQTFQTVKSEINSTNLSVYPLEGGFVIATHMNGPVNFEKKEFQLHGAKPNTQYFIYRIFQEPLRYHGTGQIIVPAMTPLYSGFSFWTDEHGNGHIITPLAPTAPSLEAIEGTVSLHIKNQLCVGLGGPVAYDTDWYETFFDWRW